MSARATWPARSRVREWQTVTVASSRTQQERRRHADHRRAADDDRVAAGDLDAGPAQDLDRGVGGRRQEAVVAERSRPALSGWIPSMSLAGSIASMTARSRIVGGSGIWTMMPSTVGSSLSARTVGRRSASVASPSSSTKPPSMPTFAQPRRIRSR